MFKMPAYDPVGIAVMGFGILLVLALVFVLRNARPKARGGWSWFSWWISAAKRACALDWQKIAMIAT